MKKFILVFILALFTTYLSAQDSISSKTLLVGVKPTPPFIISQDNGYTGISIDVWEKIAKELDLKYEYRELILPDMIKSLKNNSIDICISPLTVTSKRLESFDFMQPFYITNLTIAIKRNENSFSKKFFSMGLINTLLILIGILIVLGFFMWLSERKHYENKIRGAFGIWHFILYLGRFKKRDSDPISKSGGLIAILWGFTIIFGLSAYAVMVFFSMNVNKLAGEIESVKDLSRYTVGVIENSAPAEYLSSIGINYTEYSTLDDLFSALRQEDVETIVHDEPIMKFQLFQDQLLEKIEILPVRFNTQYYSFATPRGSALQYKVNAALFRQIENDWGLLLEKYNLAE